MVAPAVPVSNGRSNAVRQAAGTAPGNLTGRGEAGSVGREGGQPVVSGNRGGGGGGTVTSGNKKTSGKTSGKPEVETSGKLPKPLVASDPQSKSDNLPLTDDSDSDIELGAEVSKKAKGWRLEQNSDGYWRWRWQKKDNDGNPVTYVNKSGKTGYKRGCEYVPIKDVGKAKEEAGL